MILRPAIASSEASGDASAPQCCARFSASGDEGVALLEEAWRALPGDRTLRRARAAWDLSTALPED